ncbi:MAG: hypothetical protein AAFX55_12015 [Bacteroidota bacterium]
MTTYEKIFLSVYSSFAKTNRLNPISSAVAALSTLHVLNLVSFGLITGYIVDLNNKEQFMIVYLGLFCALMWIHYNLYVNNKSISQRVSALTPKTRFWCGLTFLVYALGSLFTLFWILDALWTPFIILSMVFIGLALNAYLYRKES